MKANKLLATLMLSAVLFTGCGLKGQNAIMKINGQPVTQAKFDKMMDEGLAQSPFGTMKGVKDNKDGFFYLATEQKVLNQIIIQELLEQEAKARGIKVKKADIDEALEKMYNQYGGRERLMQLLKDNGVSVSQFKKDVQTQALMQKLANSVGKIKVTDKDCENFYKKNPDKFKHPEEVRASHILIMANPYQIEEEIRSSSKDEISEKDMKILVDKKIAEKQAKAEKIAKELQADPSKFEKYARKYSEDVESAKQGGDLGFFSKDRMVPEFAKVAFSNKPNTISEVVRTQYGFHIIMPTDRMEAGSVPYVKVKGKIKDYLVTGKEVKALDELTAAAKKNAKIEYLDESYNPEAIQKKLNLQMDNLTGGQAGKIKEATKKAASQKKAKTK